MTRRLLSGCFGLALGLMASWSAHAQVGQDQSDFLIPLPRVLMTPPSTPRPAEPVAPDPNEVPEAIARQRQVLAAQRSAILQAEADQTAECWQKFAVNACLSEARRTRRQALEPLREQELALNAQERLWRTEQRERRLLNKQADTRKAP